MMFNEYAKMMIENLHTLEDTEVAAVLKALIKECDRRFLDHTDIVEEAEEEIELAAEQEEEDTAELPEWWGDMAAGLDTLTIRAQAEQADRQGW